MQDFLKDNPSFLEPTFARIWPKLPFGKHVTDFVIRRASGDYLLVELENPRKPLFTKAGRRQTAKLTQAIDQILDWYRYVEENLSTVRRELGLDGITANPKALVRSGRRRGLQTRAERARLNPGGYFRVIP
jgi:Domain of unknown function (DUF4263)